jgi:hypothetical protein
MSIMTIANPIAPVVKKKVVYPESDGKPMADKTKQFRIITTIVGCANGADYNP